MVYGRVHYIAHSDVRFNMYNRLNVSHNNQ